MSSCMKSTTWRCSFLSRPAARHLAQSSAAASHSCSSKRSSQSLPAGGGVLKRRTPALLSPDRLFQKAISSSSSSKLLQKAASSSSSSGGVEPVVLSAALLGHLHRGAPARPSPSSSTFLVAKPTIHFSKAILNIIGLKNNKIRSMLLLNDPF